MGRHTLRTCKECKETKPLQEYNKDKSCKGGHRIVCKTCLYAKRKKQLKDPEVYRKARESQRNAYLKKKFGITSAQYESMVKQANNQCEICGTTTTTCKGAKAFFVVDHCHKTGELRGILCHNCNRAIGQLGDSLEAVRKAYEYLKRFERGDTH